MQRSVAVFGAGSWGTALAISLARHGHAVHLWARRAEAAEAMHQLRENARYLPGVALPEGVAVTHNLGEAARDKAVWVVAVPSQKVRTVAEALAPHAHRDLFVVSVAKGIENETLLTTTQVLSEVLTQVPRTHLGVLSGPSHAEEVAEGKPTTVVVAAYGAEAARTLQHLFMTPRLRVYVNPDVIGVEIGGSVKNILAIAAGISDGIGGGDNTKAAIITRGMAEIQRLGHALGARPETFTGLTGIGDLVVTCMSRHSRNRYFGEQVGKGRSLADVEAEMTMVAEGVRTTASVHALAQKLGVDMPLTEAVYAVLFEGKDPRSAVHELMTRTAKPELWLPDLDEPDPA